MRCPSCGGDNPEGMKFCIECAAPLTRRCPQCAFANPPQAKFCGQCAASLRGPLPAAASPSHAADSHTPIRYTPSHLAEKILTSRSALEGERKQVTVLFADLKGSMELLADRDPEEARQLLDPVLERMMAAVHHLPNAPLKGGIRDSGGGKRPPHNQPPLIQQQTPCAPDNPAMVREAFAANLLGRAALAHAVDHR